MWKCAFPFDKALYGFLLWIRQVFIFLLFFLCDSTLSMKRHCHSTVRFANTTSFIITSLCYHLYHIYTIKCNIFGDLFLYISCGTVYILGNSTRCYCKVISCSHCSNTSSTSRCSSNSHHVCSETAQEEKDILYQSSEDQCVWKNKPGLFW